MMSPRKFVLILTFALLSVLISSCHAEPNNGNTYTSSGNQTMGLDVVGYNHTDHAIGDFSVNDRGGAFEAAHSGGGASCCIAIPEKYTPGMTVTVTWTDQYNEHPQSRVVPIPPYTSEDGGEFHVHFLRNGEIKVFVTAIIFLSNPDYPLKGAEAKM